MSDRALARLARKAGLSPVWTDARGQRRAVTPDTLRHVLNALGYPANSAAEISEGISETEHAAGAGVKEPADTPRRAYAMPDGKMWAVAVQLYALHNNSALGDFATLAEFAAEVSEYGAEGVVISPVHALFGARPTHFSPYSPSTRLFLNPLYIPVGGRKAKATPLIDWPRAHVQKMHALRRAFDEFDGDPRFDAFIRDGGPRLLAHARFEVLDARYVGEGVIGWRNWPPEWRDAGSASVRALNNRDVQFHLFLQWKAASALSAAQSRAKAAGMKIGLITDMAVGIDPDGSQAWSSRGEVLEGLNIGAPPDIFNSSGQDWGLTTFSPKGLRESGYNGFVATLRAAMRYAGGMRLDHAMGLSRLWVIPRGSSPADGIYLDYPFEELMRLIVRESAAHACVIIAEDLGTVQPGFRRRIARRALYGMRVLWFERDGTGEFIPPAAWDAQATALSTTHDLPTIAGWWTGRDITWRRKVGASLTDTRRAKKTRSVDRKKLWRALTRARCAEGAAPASAGPVVDAALAFLASTPSPLVIVPAEDLLGLREQPNLPGTIDEHLNWRQRLPDVFSSRASRRRAALLREWRGS